MAIKSEIYPITLKIQPNSSLNIDPANISINLENSQINIFNDRGGILTNNNDNSKLFKDDSNLLIGYLWDTNDTRFNIQDYFTFEFLVAIDYVTDTSQPTEKTQFKLLYTVNKLLESSNRL